MWAAAVPQRGLEARVLGPSSVPNSMLSRAGKDRRPCGWASAGSPVGAGRRARPVTQRAGPPASCGTHRSVVPAGQVNLHRAGGQLGGKQLLPAGRHARVMQAPQQSPRGHSRAEQPRALVPGRTLPKLPSPMGRMISTSSNMTCRAGGAERVTHTYWHKAQSRVHGSRGGVVPARDAPAPCARPGRPAGRPRLTSQERASTAMVEVRRTTPTSPDPPAVEGARPWEPWEPAVVMRPGICVGWGEVGGRQAEGQTGPGVLAVSADRHRCGLCSGASLQPVRRLWASTRQRGLALDWIYDRMGSSCASWRILAAVAPELRGRAGSGGRGTAQWAPFPSFACSNAGMSFPLEPAGVPAPAALHSEAATLPCPPPTPPPPCPAPFLTPWSWSSTGSSACWPPPGSPGWRRSCC